MTADCKKRILIIASDVVASTMSGTGIRCWEFARCLSREHDVTLAIPNKADIEPEGFSIVQYNLRLLAGLYRQNDVIIAQRHEPILLPLLIRLRKPIVADLYSPYPIESLAWLAGEDIKLRDLFSASELSMAKLQLQLADFFLCATERQRDFWIGTLTALGRVTPSYYDQDETLRGLIDVVPFGLPSEKPRHTRRVLKGVHEQVLTSDRLLIWNGGLWSWLDPLTLIRAMAEVTKVRSNVKLFFMGTGNPNPNLFAMTMYDKAVQLSKDLGLYNRQIIFNEGWLPYEERHNYLLEADICIITHRQHTETHLSFRTRGLDCLWTGLPLIVSDGGSISELVRDNNLGLVVPPEDEQALAQAILELLDSPDQIAECKMNLEGTAQRFVWQNVITPLEDFCRNPQVRGNKSANSIRLCHAIFNHYVRRVSLEMKHRGFRRTFKRICLKIGVSNE